MRLTFILLFVLSFLPTVGYSKSGSSDWQWHGFVAQGLIDVNHSNFVDNNSGLSPKLTELGINSSYNFLSNVRVAGQLVYLNGGRRYAEGVRLDYLLLDWGIFNDANWQVNMYLGRFKNNHWLYSNTRDIPFARPSIILPQSIYYDGFRDIAMGGDGGALRINYSDDKLGEIDFNFSSGVSSINKKAKQVILSEYATGDIKQSFDNQASLYWRPNFSAWRFGLSMLDSNFDYQRGAGADLFYDGVFAFQYYTMNAIYEGERWELSSEIHHQHFKTSGFYQSSYVKTNIGQGAYVQARYKYNNDLTLLMRAEKFYLDRADKNGSKLNAASGGKIPRYFGFQNDLTVGFSYDIQDHLRVQFEQHWVQGTGRLSPTVLPNPQINNREYWQMWAVQLMYWF